MRASKFARYRDIQIYAMRGSKVTGTKVTGENWVNHKAKFFFDIDGTKYVEEFGWWGYFQKTQKEAGPRHRRDYQRKALQKLKRKIGGILNAKAKNKN
jgi:hypothetical protein